MVRKAICFVVIALFAATGMGPVYAGIASKYEVVRISPDGASLGSSLRITNSGIVCGYGSDAGGRSGLVRYNINTGLTEFTDQICTMEDINNSGAVAGTYYTRNGSSHLCVWNPDGSVTDLPLSTEYTGGNARINDAGELLGGSSGDFIWSGESAVRYPAKPSAHTYWDIADMNNRGTYLGSAWSPMVVLPPLTPLVTVSDGTSLASHQLTDLIAIVGSESYNAIWSEDGSYHEFDKSQARWTRLNDADQVVGTEDVDGDYHVVFWDAQKGKLDLTADMTGSYNCRDFNNVGQVLIGRTLRLIDLQPGTTLWGLPSESIWDPDSGIRSTSSLLDPTSGWGIYNCSGINDQGWIVAQGSNSAEGWSGTVILRPVLTPEPSAMIALLVGFSGIIGFAGRRQNRR